MLCPDSVLELIISVTARTFLYDVGWEEKYRTLPGVVIFDEAAHTSKELFIN